ncbi:hypothetical protein LINGRAHAP2_LOCUS13955 [Linum grandiflorum]
MKNSSQRRCSFSRKCARLVKEQRAREIESAKFHSNTGRQS